MPDVQTPDQRRLGDIETQVGVLKSTDLTFAKLLDGVAMTLKELNQQDVDARAASYPPFSDVLRNAGIVAALMTSVLIGLGYIVSNHITQATAVSEYRLAVLERELKEFKEQAKVTYTWRTITETR